MASIALPSWRKIEAPASLASGLAAVTIQFLALTNDLCSKPVACSGATASVA
ncbi:gamma-glutamyltransferase 1 domain protein [Vibrio cholerae]|nr:gamma-glutamyltransferase 1 domain protein [Vibrio cholerae]